MLNAKIGEFEKKIPGTSGLVTTSVLNKKLGKLKTKYQMLLVYSRKQIVTLNIRHWEKYFITFDYNKVTKEILDAKIKEKELVDKFDISKLVKNSDLHARFKTLAKKAELEAEQDKIVKLQTHDLSYFLDRIFFGDDCFQNMFVYQLTFNTLQLKKTRELIMLLVGNHKVYLNLSFFHYMVLSYLT